MNEISMSGSSHEKISEDVSENASKQQLSSSLSSHLLVWSLRRWTCAGVDSNKCVPFVAIVDVVMIVPLGVLAVVRVDAIVVVRRIPTVDIEIVCGDVWGRWRD